MKNQLQINWQTAKDEFISKKLKEMKDETPAIDGYKLHEDGIIISVGHLFYFSSYKNLSYKHQYSLDEYDLKELAMQMDALDCTNWLEEIWIQQEWSEFFMNRLQDVVFENIQLCLLPAEASQALEEYQSTFSKTFELHPMEQNEPFPMIDKYAATDMYTSEELAPYEVQYVASSK